MQNDPNSEPFIEAEEVMLGDWSESASQDKNITLLFPPRHIKTLRRFRRKRISLTMVDENHQPVGPGVFETWGIGAGDMWLKLRVEDLEHFKGRQEQLFGVNLRVLEEDQHIQPQTKTEKKPAPYGQEANALRKSGFFNDPEVQRLVADYCSIERGKISPQMCWDALKKKFGFIHWNEVPPVVLTKWASGNNIKWKLPREYKYTKYEE